MSTPVDSASTQNNFERLRAVVSEHFQLEEALIEYNIPTFYLRQPQETKQAFLKLHKELDGMNFMAFLRRVNGRTVLKVFPKPVSKPSNVIVNWLLFLATVGTTFITGYILSMNLERIGGPINPILGGLMFTVVIMAIFGLHEMGHMLTASKNGVEATPPYFIPGPPPTLGGFGTFGAVIVQRSLPPNKDSLFDIGFSGPIVSFIMAAVAAAFGATMAVPAEPVEGAVELPEPIMMYIIWILLLWSGQAPQASLGKRLYMHPVEFAGWVGMLITALNILPVAMLDGGHIARSLLGDKARAVLAALSILLLALSGFWLMALFVLFLSLQRHPGPLDDVSELSKSRKVLAAVLVAVFVLAFPMVY
ncbi:MAG: site-2 protease family protein [Candidatus Bathyarchaeota archaeon]|nr:site-2 protease family protein [Candidatus Bathyarchaeota archaeon]